MDNTNLMSNERYLEILRDRRKQELRQAESPKLPVLHPRPCPYCGETIHPDQIEILGKVRYFYVEWCSCGPAQQAKKQQEAESEKAALEREFVKLWERSGATGGEYDTMTINTWDVTRHKEARQHLNDVINYCTNVSTIPPNLLYLYGLYGRGKTHLALVALRKIVRDHIDEIRGHLSPCFVEWLEHCSKVQATWNRDDSDTGPTEDQLWNRMKGAGILVIDDIDKGRVNEWTMSKLLEVIQYRYMHHKSLIITANRSLLELEQFWTSSKLEYVRDTGAAICSRLSKMLMRQIHVVGEDQRDK